METGIANSFHAKFGMSFAQMQRGTGVAREQRQRLWDSPLVLGVDNYGKSWVFAKKLEALCDEQGLDTDCHHVQQAIIAMCTTISPDYEQFLKTAPNMKLFVNLVVHEQPGSSDMSGGWEWSEEVTLLVVSGLSFAWKFASAHEITVRFTDNSGTVGFDWESAPGYLRIGVRSPKVSNIYQAGFSMRAKPSSIVGLPLVALKVAEGFKWLGGWSQSNEEFKWTFSWDDSDAVPDPKMGPLILLDELGRHEAAKAMLVQQCCEHVRLPRVRKHLVARLAHLACADCVRRLTALFFVRSPIASM